MARVMIVNDEPDLLEICRMLLEDKGHTTVVTTDSAQAVHLAATLKPDFVLLDWVMREIHGDELLRRLRRLESTAGVPIVMMSALADGAERSRRAGADAFLPKPFDADQLERIVDEFTQPPREPHTEAD